MRTISGIFRGKSALLSGFAVLGVALAIPGFVGASGTVAGLDTPGITTYPDGPPEQVLQRTGAIPASINEPNYRAAAMAPDGSAAYFGTWAGAVLTSPGTVIKINPDTFASEGILTFEPDEVHVFSAAITPDGSTGYFGTGGDPATLVKVDLDTFTRVDALTLQAGESSIHNITITPDGQTAFLGTSTSPGRIIRVDLNTFTRTGTLDFETGENLPISAVMTSDGSKIYYACYSSPGRVVRVDVDLFQRDGAATLSAPAPYRALISPDDSSAYFTMTSSPASLIKVDLSTFNEVDVLWLETNETLPFGAAISPDGMHAYIATHFPGHVVRVNLNSFTREDALAVDASDGSPFPLVIQPDGTRLFLGTWGSPSNILEINLLGDPITTQQGFLKGTRFTMTESGDLVDVRLYSHTASGNVRLAIYNDESPRELLWESGAVANTQTDEAIVVAVGDGSPSSLIIPAGDYSVAWQVDTDDPVVSYTAGDPGDGFRLMQPFGAAPATIDSGVADSTSETWTAWITYSASASASTWMDF